MKTKVNSRWWGAAILGCAMIAQTAHAVVVVYGEAVSSGPSITVSLYADITDTPIVSFGVRVLYDSQTLSVQGASKNNSVWYLSDGTNRLRYLEPDLSVPGTVLILGAKFDGLNPLQGVLGQRVLLGNLSFARQAALPVQFGLALGRPSSFANFVSASAVVLDSGIVFSGIQNDPNDTDLDGLPDAWELHYFGTLGQASWNDDPDGDGFNNLQEYWADTNPADGTSYLHMTSISPTGPGVLVQWQGGIQATQYLQRCLLNGSRTFWTDILTSTPPTAVTGSYTDWFNDINVKFYRVRATR